MGKRLTYQEVKKRFKDAGCELLEDSYLNNKSKVKYICSCGNRSEIRLYSFFQGHRCMACGSESTGLKNKYTFEYVKQYFEDYNCKLLETVYVNNATRMRFICSCGNRSKISFNNLTSGQKCIKCGGKEKHTFEHIKQFFKSKDCELLETKYLNNKIKMKYICSCGSKAEIKFGSFRLGTRCQECNKKNNANYNPNLTDEERADRRKNLEYKQWTKDIYKKDGYICQKCFKVGRKLNAHHIEGFAENKKLRTDIDNGITFCQDCHNLFHAIYGKKNITKKQLDDFMIKISMKRTG